MMSRLPEYPSYWDKLSDRLVANAAIQLREYQTKTSGRWSALARLSLPLAIGAAAAVVVALLRLPGTARESRENATTASGYGFSPNDPWATLLVTSARPPSMATLLSTPNSERVQ